MTPANKTVLVVTPLFPSDKRPYYCIYLLQLFDALKACGYTVHVLMPDSGLPDGEIKKDQHRSFPLIHIGHCNGLANEILGKMSRGFVRSVKKVMEALKPDIIDLNLCSAACSGTFIALARQVGAKSVVHYHGLNVFYNHHSAHPWLEKILAYARVRNCDRADAIVGVSDKVAENVRTRSDNASVYTVYNGVDTSLFYPSEAKANAVFTIVCVANLIRIKGHEFLLRAAAEVIGAQGHRLCIRIIGAGPEAERLQKLVAELGIEEAVVFLGEKHYDVVSQEIRQADFFIMPSYFESLGCVYLEAMASGVAAMGVKGCGIDEIIEDKENGYLVDPCNVEQIKERILFAINNPEKHGEIARAGYDTAVNKYRWAHAGEALDRVYQDLLHRS